MSSQVSKVVFSLLDSPAFGGAEQYLFSLLRHLQSTGHSIVLATNNDQVANELNSRLTARERRTFSIIKAPYRLDAIGNWKGLVKFFLAIPQACGWCFWQLHTLSKQYDQVICLWVGFSDRLAFSFLAKQIGARLIWIDIGPLEPVFKRNWGFPKLLYHWAEQFPNFVATTSLFTLQSLRRLTQFKDEQLGLLYPGTKLFSKKEREALALQAQQWKVANKLETSKLVVVMARLAHENELMVVIKAFAIYLTAAAKKKVLGAKLVIIGDGPQRAELEQQVQVLGIVDQVMFTGFVSEQEKRVVLSAGEFFVFPRAWELDGFGMTTIEAMALGLPVLTTNFGPQIEIVSNGREGFRYRPHNPKSLAKYIQKMFELPTSVKEKMKKYALNRAEAFSEAKMQEKLDEMVKKYS